MNYISIICLICKPLKSFHIFSIVTVSKDAVFYTPIDNPAVEALHCFSDPTLRLLNRIKIMKDATKCFGSDVFEPLTHLYGWEANQVAHTMMGFAGATLFAYTAVDLGRSHWWALLFLVIPILKDITDYFVDTHSVGGTFAIKEHLKKELRLDGVTDFFFWSAGTVLALFFYYAAHSSSLMVYLVLVPVGLYVYFGARMLARHHKPRKTAFDRSGLPVYCRLPMLRCTLAAHDQAVAVVRRFIAVQDPNHLILTGPARSGKTRLCCAIGTQLTAQETSVYYATAEQLRHDLQQLMQGDSDGDQLQRLQESQFVICDDALDPYAAELEPSLQEALAQKRVIWVMARNSESISVWEQWLKRLFHLDELPVITIVSEPSTVADSRRPQQPFVSHLMSWLTLLTAGISFFIVFCVLIFM